MMPPPQGQHKLAARKDQVEPLQFELSRHVLKKVVAAIKFENKADASWLKLEYIRPSTELGVPITIDSNDAELPRIQYVWAMAIKADPTIKDEGALILNAKKNGIPVNGIDLSKYHVNPDAAQANITAKPASANARHPSLSSGPVTSSPGGVNVPKSSPTAVSPTSTLRSSSSPEVPDNSMTDARSYSIRERAYLVGESQKPDGMASMLGSHQQSARHAPGQGTEVDAAPRRRRGYSGSTAYSIATTTVTFQANISTGPNVIAVPFNLDNMNEAIDDIVAYVDWKNSEAGRLSPVDFKTFLSIMRFRPGPANALVLRTAE